MSTISTIALQSEEIPGMRCQNNLKQVDHYQGIQAIVAGIGTVSIHILITGLSRHMILPHVQGLNHHITPFTIDHDRPHGYTSHHQIQWHRDRDLDHHRKMHCRLKEVTLIRTMMRLGGIGLTRNISLHITGIIIARRQIQLMKVLEDTDPERQVQGISHLLRHRINILIRPSLMSEAMPTLFLMIVMSNLA